MRQYPRFQLSIFSIRDMHQSKRDSFSFLHGRTYRYFTNESLQLWVNIHTPILQIPDAASFSFLIMIFITYFTPRVAIPTIGARTRQANSFRRAKSRYHIHFKRWYALCYAADEQQYDRIHAYGAMQCLIIATAHRRDDMMPIFIDMRCHSKGVYAIIYMAIGSPLASRLPRRLTPTLAT